MMKGLACIALLFAVFVATQGFPQWGSGRGNGGSNWGKGGPNWGNGGQHHGGWGPNLTVLCSNLTAASAFLTQIQSLISTLQSNGSFGQFLTAKAQEIAYLTNADNTATLTTNCTGYFSGLQAAKLADQTAVKAQFQYIQSAAQAFKQILQSFIGGGNGNSNSDSNQND